MSEFDPADWQTCDKHEVVFPRHSVCPHCRIRELEALAKAKYIDGQLNAEIALLPKIQELEEQKATLITELREMEKKWFDRRSLDWNVTKCCNDITALLDKQSQSG